jgi:hypothetical protein
MSPRQDSAPPRPITPGDIVAGYSDELGEWTAAQVTHLDFGWRTAGVVQLNWSGPEPFCVDDVGVLEPLRLTHHAHSGNLEHVNFHWLLPRSCKVLGSAPLLVDRPSYSYSTGWRLGDQLDRQRRWDAGDREPVDTGRLKLTLPELGVLSEAPAGVWSLVVHEIDQLDCEDIVGSFPTLTRLSLDGNLGTLRNARFGMTAAQRPNPARLTHLDALFLHSVPADYARAVRKAWTPEIGHGTHLDVSRPRQPGWVAENRDNPLREWDGRPHISSARYKKAVAQYGITRADVVAALSRGHDVAQLEALGRDYGEAFNRLDGSRNPFIETVEREELFDVLAATVTYAEATLGRAFPQAREHLIDGLETVRDW